MHLEELRMALLRELALGNTGEALLGQLEEAAEGSRRWPAWRRA